MRFKTKARRKITINITSLIDVLFLLLIFLMVSSTFLEQPGIKLDLPEAQSAVVVEQKEYILFVDKEKNVFLNDFPVPLDQLEEKLKEVLPKMKDGALIGLVVRIMDNIKKSGVKRLVIGTKLQ